MEEALARGVQIFLALSVAYFVALWFALAVWAYRDINSRSQSVVTQVVGTLLVVLFSIPGALLYLLLRPKESLDEAYQRSLEEEYLLQDLEDVAVCFSCKRQVDEEYMLCPHCQTVLKDACAGCSKLIDVKWTVCPYCGVNQSDRSTIIREQLPPAQDRFVERGAGAFAPLQPPPSSISPAAQIEAAPPDQFIGPVYPAASFEPVVQTFPDPLEEELEPTEPIRLFDRKRTKALKANADSVPANGSASAAATDAVPRDDLHEAETASVSEREPSESGKSFPPASGHA